MGFASFIMLISGIMGALSNLCMRKSMDARGTVGSFFFFQMLFTTCVVTFMHPIHTGCYSINLYTLSMGTACGLALGFLKYMMGFALQKGPASLTFASVNCASVAPSIIFATCFASLVDFPYTSWNLLGSALVCAGLLWAINHQTKWRHKWSWIIFAATAFGVQTLYLVLTQWHVFIRQNVHWLSEMMRYGSDQVHSEWFVPVVFGVAAIMHFILFLVREKRLPTKAEAICGILGGLCNGACAYLFMQATDLATGCERALLFPLFSVSLIITCNLWGEWLYKEMVNWKANALCIAGLIVGTMEA